MKTINTWFLANSLFTASLLFLVSPRISIDLGFALTPVYFINIFMIVCFILSSKTMYASKGMIYAFAPLLIFYMFCCLSIFYTSDISLSFRFVLGLIYFLSTILIHTFFFHHFKLDLNLILRFVVKYYLIISFILYLLGLLFVSNVPEGVASFGILKEKGIPRAVGLMKDPNIAALVFLSFYYYLFFVSIKNKSFYLLLVVFLIFATLSRGAIATFLITLLLFSLRSIKHFTFFIFYSSIFLILAGFLYINLESFAQIFEKRLSGLETGAGRFEMWENAYNLFLQSPILGHGIFNFRFLNELYFNDSHFAHNTYIEVIVETGIIGLTLFFLYLSSLLGMAYKNDALFFSVLALIVMALTISIYINPIFIFINIIIFCYNTSKYR